MVSDPGSLTYSPPPPHPLTPVPNTEAVDVPWCGSRPHPARNQRCSRPRITPAPLRMEGASARMGRCPAPSGARGEAVGSLTGWAAPAFGRDKVPPGPGTRVRGRRLPAPVTCLPSAAAGAGRGEAGFPGGSAAGPARGTRVFPLKLRSQGFQLGAPSPPPPQRPMGLFAALMSPISRSSPAAKDSSRGGE